MLAGPLSGGPWTLRIPPPEAAIPVPRVPGLRLVSAGYVTARSVEIFQDARLGRAFQDMRAQADFVVVVGAPVLEISHTLALARVSDIVAVVADARHTSREAASAAALLEIGETFGGEDALGFFARHTVAPVLIASGTASALVYVMVDPRPLYVTAAQPSGGYAVQSVRSIAGRQ